MSVEVKTQSQIPDAPFYVTAVDSFMSGWGPADGKNNIIILPCVDADEAQRVAEYAKSRPDQEGVMISDSKPVMDRESNLYSLMTHTNAARWYRGL